MAGQRHDRLVGRATLSKLRNSAVAQVMKPEPREPRHSLLLLSLYCFRLCARFQRGVCGGTCGPLRGFLHECAPSRSPGPLWPCGVLSVAASRYSGIDPDYYNTVRVGC